MNPNSTWLRRDAQDEKDERFVADYLEKQGMKAVKRDAVVLDLDAAYGCWAEKRDPALIVGRLRLTRSVAAVAIADQIEAQSRPPKPAEPTGLGAVVEDSEGHLWVRTDPDAPAWTRWDASLTRVSYERIDVAKKLSDGWEPKP